MANETKKKTPPRRHPLRKVSKSPVDYEREKKNPPARKRRHRQGVEAPLPELTNAQVKELKAAAHHLEPVVMVGDKGISEAVIEALHEAFDSHELLKVKMRAPEDKQAMAQELATKSRSLLIGLIGHVVILYKPFPPKPRGE